MPAPATPSRWIAFRSCSASIFDVSLRQAHDPGRADAAGRSSDILKARTHHALRADAGAQSAGGGSCPGLELCRPQPPAPAQLHRISGAGWAAYDLDAYGGIARRSAGRLISCRAIWIAPGAVGRGGTELEPERADDGHRFAARAASRMLRRRGSPGHYTSARLTLDHEYRRDVLLRVSGACSAPTT